jgi:hypothetical protein
MNDYTTTWGTFPHESATGYVSEDTDISNGTFTVTTGDISFSGTMTGKMGPPVRDCEVCGEAQEKHVCPVCAVAVKEYRNEAFRKQIEELL